MLKRRTGVYAELRLQRICAALQEHGEVSVAELCEQFSMSAATIRADLAKLEAQQRLRRTHGGAIPWERPVWKPPIREVPPQSKTAKAMIAQKALQYLRPGSVAALDAGTTTLELARRMRDLQDLTVITKPGSPCVWSRPEGSTRCCLAGCCRGRCTARWVQIFCGRWSRCISIRCFWRRTASASGTG